MANRLRLYVGLLLALAGGGGLYYTWAVTAPEAARLREQIAGTTAAQSDASGPSGTDHRTQEVTIHVGRGRPPAAQQILEQRAESWLEQHRRAAVAAEIQGQRGERLAALRQEYAAVAGRRIRHFLLGAVVLAYGVYSAALALYREASGRGRQSHD